MNLSRLNLDRSESAGKEIEENLIRIRKSVGAPIGEIELIDTEIDEEDHLSDYFDEIQQDQPLIKDNKFHMVYIKDHQNPRFYSKDARDAEVKAHSNNCFVSGKKVHFYYCRTLIQMTEQGRRSRYRVTRKTDNIRVIDLPEEENLITRLPWCRHCINVLCEIPENIRALQQIAEEYRDDNNLRNRIAEYGDAEELMNCVKTCYSKDPSTAEAMKKFTQTLRNDYQSTNYPKNWGTISNAYRKYRDYKCAICSVKCNEHRYLTDTHHINGVKTDCTHKNLKCLCKYHHANLHGYKTKKEDLQALQKLWEEQNIPHHLRG